MKIRIVPKNLWRYNGNSYTDNFYNFSLIEFQYSKNLLKSIQTYTIYLSFTLINFNITIYLKIK